MSSCAKTTTTVVFHCEVCETEMTMNVTPSYRIGIRISGVPCLACGATFTLELCPDGADPDFIPIVFFDPFRHVVAA